MEVKALSLLCALSPSGEDNATPRNLLARLCPRNAMEGEPAATQDMDRKTKRKLRKARNTRSETPVSEESGEPPVFDFKKWNKSEMLALLRTWQRDSKMINANWTEHVKKSWSGSGPLTLARHGTEELRNFLTAQRPPARLRPSRKGKQKGPAIALSSKAGAPIPPIKIARKLKADPGRRNDGHGMHHEKKGRVLPAAKKQDDSRSEEEYSEEYVSPERQERPLRRVTERPSAARGARMQETLRGRGRSRERPSYKEGIAGRSPSSSRSRSTRRRNHEPARPHGEWRSRSPSRAAARSPKERLEKEIDALKSRHAAMDVDLERLKLQAKFNHGTRSTAGAAREKPRAETAGKSSGARGRR